MKYEEVKVHDDVMIVSKNTQLLNQIVTIGLQLKSGASPSPRTLPLQRKIDKEADSACLD